MVIVFGIAGIWVGACVWRRHHLRKKDRQYALGKSLAATQAGGHPAGQSQRSVHLPQAGFFAPANLSSANVYDIEKPKQKKDRQRWTVNEET